MKVRLRHYFQVLILLLILSSCTYQKEECICPPTLIGRWKLTEILADPGDGSGRFTPTDVEMYIDFYSDSTFIVNRVMCDISMGLTETLTSGVIDTASKTLLLENCSRPVWFEIVENNLIISYYSDEPYRQKFKKLCPEVIGE